jgi:membrane protease YdiL (CAAX protease family)
MILEILEIIALFILPVLLVYFKIIPFRHRMQTLYIVTAIIIAIVLIERWPLEKLGIRFDNIISSTIPYAIFTILGILAILAVSRILKKKPQMQFFKKRHFIYGFLLVSIAQEFLFRGFLFPKLGEIIGTNSGTIQFDIMLIITNAILFTLIHSIYSNDWTSLMMIFFGGICFASIYLVYPNLILITIAHAILNFLAVLYNFYHEEKTNIKIASYWSRIIGQWNKVKEKAQRKRTNT